MTRKVTLIGYRGSGKSAVAVPLARALGATVVDADDELERRTGVSIREIFERHGEPHFRRLEREVLADLLSRDEHLVVAAGGGAVLDDNNRQTMRTAGPVVWLVAGVDALEARINADASTADRRPNLTNLGGRAEIERLLVEREPFYRECATIRIETDARSIDEIVLGIVERLRGKNGDAL